MAGEAAAQTRIVIADDHTIVRAGLRSLLMSEPTFQVVGEASDGAETVIAVQELRPDVLIVDISMPNMGGLDAIERVHDVAPSVKVIVLTMHEDERYVLQAIDAGAHGYLVKGADPSELRLAIRAVTRGEAYFCPAVAKLIVARYVSRKNIGGSRNAIPRPLTGRELQVLRLIADGLTSREIAARLFLSGNTVERHRANIMEKLQVHNRAQLVRRALEEGYAAPSA